MAKYREKSEADLAWDRIRREIQSRVNTAAANWRDETLNQILPRVQDEFEASLSKGVLLELETGAKGFIDAMVEEAVDAPSPR